MTFPLIRRLRRHVRARRYDRAITRQEIAAGREHLARPCDDPACMCQPHRR